MITFPLAVLVSLVLGALALSGVTASGQSGASQPEAFLEPHSLVVAANRPVCSLLDDVQSEASILGQDGGTSVEAAGRIYWSFNDTWVINGAGVHELIPNNIAVTDDRNASDCVSLTSRVGAGGHAAPTILRMPGENGIFASGMVSVNPGSVHFLYASSVPDPNADIGYRIRGFGLGRFQTSTLAGERLLDGKLIWDDGSFPGAHLDEALALEHDGTVFALLRLTLGLQAGTLLARTAADNLERAEFEYWNGSSWTTMIPDVSTPEAARKALLWVQSIGMSAPSIAYNEFLGKWTAIYTGGFASVVEARVADDIIGPWTDEPATLAIDCLDFLPTPQSGFICYMAQQHPSYTSDDGRTVYVTWSNFDAYRTYLHELRLGSPVSQWSEDDGSVDYRTSDDAEPGYRREGIAFYASDSPIPGFAAIHRWRDGANGELRLAPTAPGESYGDGGIAFYAPLDEQAAKNANALFAPVYRWTAGEVERYSALDLRAAGFAVAERAFYTACPDSDRDRLTDCAESFGASEGDSDGDGLEDQFESDTFGCDPMVANDDLDGVPTDAELALGRTNPCVWDSGSWGCATAPLRDPGCDHDSDGDRCRDAWELGPNPQFGGMRDPRDQWDYFNPSEDGMNRTDDILAVINHYYAAVGDPDYSTAFDRGGLDGPNAWDVLPPDGRVRIDDILAAVRSYLQDCP